MADLPHKAGKSKKGRKIGRNIAFCERYRRENRRDKNKARRAAKRERHFKKI